MSAARNLPQTAWRPFFDVVSKALIGKRAEVEAASLELGTQVVAEWLPLIGITYDSHNDLLDVAMEGPDHFDHLIRHPRQIAVVEGRDGIESIGVTADDDVEEVIRFKNPLMLPAAGAGA
jgi:hypothetical protein